MFLSIYFNVESARETKAALFGVDGTSQLIFHPLPLHYEYVVTSCERLALNPASHATPRFIIFIPFTPSRTRRWHAVALWLGMAKAGVCTALVNIHIKGPPLVHAIQTALNQSRNKVVVVDQSLAACILCHEVLAELSPAVSHSFIQLKKNLFRFKKASVDVKVGL